MRTPHIFESMSSDELCEHLKQSGSRFDQPMLLAFDCDDTIVNRAKGPHFIAKSIQTMFGQLRQNGGVKTAINTGRDALCYRPVQEQIGPVDACLFVAGRVLRMGDETEILPSAKLLPSLCERVWHLLRENIIAFVEVRTSKTSYFVSNHPDQMQQYMGHDRPADWFDQFGRNIYCADDQNAQQLVKSGEVVRLDIAFFDDQHPKLVKAVENRDLSYAKFELAQLLPNLANLTCSPIPTSPQRHLGSKKIAALCLFSQTKSNNKGKGLQITAQRLQIPEENVFSFGDSSSVDASDLAVADFLPKSHLLIASNGDERAKSQADFIIDSIHQEGVVRAVEQISRLWR